MSANKWCKIIGLGGNTGNKYGFFSHVVYVVNFGNKSHAFLLIGNKYVDMMVIMSRGRWGKKNSFSEKASVVRHFNIYPKYSFIIL